MSKLHLLLPFVVAALALAFLDPFNFLMLGMTAEFTLGVLALITIGYGALLFKEQVRDERDVGIRAFAHRASYIVSVGGLVAIIAHQILTMGMVYPEIVYLLVLVVATKTLCHWFGDKNF
ncbi:hypothetical protein H6778_01335 [Candidatus Nomurabacteria bacterium]|nr:hypothetical protein [Candidatus Nomurabacteria bacterium]